MAGFNMVPMMAAAIINMQAVSNNLRRASLNNARRIQQNNKKNGK